MAARGPELTRRDTAANFDQNKLPKKWLSDGIPAAGHYRAAVVSPDPDPDIAFKQGNKNMEMKQDGIMYRQTNFLKGIRLGLVRLLFRFLSFFWDVLCRFYLCYNVGSKVGSY